MNGATKYTSVGGLIPFDDDPNFLTFCRFASLISILAPSGGHSVHFKEEHDVNRESLKTFDLLIARIDQRGIPLSIVDTISSTKVRRRKKNKNYTTTFDATRNSQG